MSGAGDDGVVDRIRSHFIQCSKCSEGAKLCPCRSRRRFLQQTAGAAGVVSALGSRTLIETVGAADADGRAGAAVTDTLSMTTEQVFPQSVASGGPTDAGVILWTRVGDDALDRRTDALSVTVARDPGLSDVVHEGSIPHETVTGNDNCVRYDLDGELDSNTVYFYQFAYGGVTSNLGRCRTLPAEDESVSELQFVVANCNHYQNGYFHAFGFAADHAADFMLHLGDFVYESSGGVFTSSNHKGDDSVSPPVRTLSGPAFDDIEQSGGSLAYTTDDYRRLYRQYKADRNLQRALEQHTMIYTWDDHDVADDRYWADGPATTGWQTLTVERYASAIQAWLEHVPARVEMDRDRIVDAAREDAADDGGPPTTESGTALSLHDVFKLYDDKSFGDLIDLLVTDERFYRDQPPSSHTPTETFGAVQREMDDTEREREQFREEMEENCEDTTARERAFRPDCRASGGIDEDRLDERVEDNNDFHDALQETLDRTRDGTEDTLEFATEQDGAGNDPHHADRTMLGFGQKTWFERTLHEADATWTLWMNEVLLSPLTVSEPNGTTADIGQIWPGTDALGYLPDQDDTPGAVEVYHDAWDGYIRERRDLLTAASDRLDNLVALTGDMHASLVSELWAPNYASDADRAGVELMVPAATSETPYEQMTEGDDSLANQIPKNSLLSSPDPVERLGTALTQMNNHVKEIDLRSTGYALVTVDHDELTYTTFDVDRSRRDSTERRPMLRAVVPEGANRPQFPGGPVAVATMDRQVVTEGETVAFDASATAGTDRLGDGRTPEYRWSFGDGTTTTRSDGATVEHTFEQPGAHEVELEFAEVADGLLGSRTAASDTVSLRVVVRPDNDAPEAAISHTNLDGPTDDVWVGDEVQFSARETSDPDGAVAAEIERLEWRFGDGSDPVSGPPTRTGVDGATTVTHAFEQPGTYEVTLTATDEARATDSTTRTLSVTESRPDAVLDYRRTDTGDDTATVQFTATPDPGPLRTYTYEWAFGDGETATRSDGDDANTVTHRYERPGDYTVTLTVAADGAEDTVTRTVSVGGGASDTGGPVGGDFTGRLNPDDRWTETYAVRRDTPAVEVRLVGPSGADFDLYVTTDGSRPTLEEFDRAARSATASETVRLDRALAAGQELGLLVHSYEGGGRFAVSVTEARSDGSIPEVRPADSGAGTGGPTPTDDPEQVQEYGDAWAEINGGPDPSTAGPGGESGGPAGGDTTGGTTDTPSGAADSEPGGLGDAWSDVGTDADTDGGAGTAPSAGADSGGDAGAGTGTGTGTDTEDTNLTDGWAVAEAQTDAYSERVGRSTGGGGTDTGGDGSGDSGSSSRPGAGPIESAVEAVVEAVTDLI